MSWQQHIDSLPPSARAAIENEATRRGTTPEKLACQMGERYTNSSGYRRRIDRILNEILRLSKLKKPIRHLIPRNDCDALLINMILQIRGNRLWPGVGKVVSKSLEVGQD